MYTYLCVPISAWVNTCLYYFFNEFCLTPYISTLYPKAYNTPLSNPSHHTERDVSMSPKLAGGDGLFFDSEGEEDDGGSDDDDDGEYNGTGGGGGGLLKRVRSAPNPGGLLPARIDRYPEEEEVGSDDSSNDGAPGGGQEVGWGHGTRGLHLEVRFGPPSFVVPTGVVWAGALQASRSTRMLCLLQQVHRPFGKYGVCHLVPSCLSSAALEKHNVYR